MSRRIAFDEVHRLDWKSTRSNGTRHLPRIQPESGIDPFSNLCSHPPSASATSNRHDPHQKNQTTLLYIPSSSSTYSLLLFPISPVFPILFPSSSSSPDSLPPPSASRLAAHSSAPTPAGPWLDCSSAAAPWPASISPSPASAVPLATCRIRGVVECVCDRRRCTHGVGGDGTLWGDFGP